MDVVVDSLLAAIPDLGGRRRCTLYHSSSGSFFILDEEFDSNFGVLSVVLVMGTEASCGQVDHIAIGF